MATRDYHGFPEIFLRNSRVRAVEELLLASEEAAFVEIQGVQSEMQTKEQL